ncbi:MAG: ATP phosphoribosyltransferase [Dehalococcoidia bacterium]|nr:ATP phosphoribosyltransferase [Dehalococcoidia bacterium]
MRLALPKGGLLAETKILLETSGFDVHHYGDGSRSYRPECKNLPGLSLKVFHEKDIPIQVAIGNYDLGICGLDWVRELTVKYPSSALVELRDLGYGKHDLCVASSGLSGISSLSELKDYDGDIRLASEYPHMAESFAMKLRLKKFRIFPVWGAAESYPPENAEAVLVSCSPAKGGLLDSGLISLVHVLSSGACLIANRDSWERKDVSPLLNLFSDGDTVGVSRNGEDGLEAVSDSSHFPVSVPLRSDSGVVRLALPDGHQQKPTVELLERAGFDVREYTAGMVRPDIGIDYLDVKVIRPQDMPLQVANGNFDMAITGTDWLREHRYRFPSSPVKEILNLGFGKVRIVAVVARDVPVSNANELRKLLRDGELPSIRVVSEYVAIADRYAGDKRLSPYRMIPSWGASEAFLPEDADLLIENTETGRTIARHNLKIIDTLFESSACLIGNVDSLAECNKVDKADSVVEAIRHSLHNVR